MQKKLVIIILALFFMQFFVSCERQTAQVKAVFTLNCEDNETLPCIVNFENQSLNSDSYLWNFGDGTVSTEENPSHQYTEKGDYKIILTAKNGGGTDTVSQMFSVKDYRDKWVGEYNCDVYKKVTYYDFYTNDATVTESNFTEIVEVEKSDEDSLLIMTLKTHEPISVFHLLLKKDGYFGYIDNSNFHGTFDGNFVNDIVYINFIESSHLFVF